MITEDQFHGIDNNPNIIAANRIAYPNAHWYTGDFIWTLLREAPQQPAVINLDSMTRYKSTIGTMLNVMRHRQGPCLMITNIVSMFRGVRDDQSVIIDYLESHPGWGETGEWELYPQAATYRNRGTEMTSLITYHQGQYYEVVDDQTPSSTPSSL